MNNKLFLFKSLIFIVICICILFINSVYFAISSTESYDTTQSLAVNVVGFDSKEEGDCIIITYENTEILIDSCQSEDCFNTIKTKMENCISSDGIWDYIIFTHPDYDHIGNAVKVLDLFDSNNGWSIDHIIDFDFVTSDDIFTNAFYTKTAKEYIKRRNELVEKYNIEYFSASSLSKSVLVKTYNIGKTASLTILYNYYDDLDVLKELSGASDSTKHNLISVCCLIQIDQQKLLFTGDLPEYDSGR